MFILHGIYHFKPKVVAYRNDFCLRCSVPRRAYQTRSFDAVHLYYIPILPLGFLRHWRCSVCKNPPHVSPYTRKSFKWAAVFILPLFTAVAWIPGVAERDSVVIMWFMRVGLPIAFVAALRWAIRSKPDINLKQKLKEISPAQEKVCPLCGGVFVVDSQWHCCKCGVVRAALRA